MKKFIAIYSTPLEMHASMDELSPDQKAEAMKPWFAWKEKYGNAIVDFGAPFRTGSTSKDGKSWSPSKRETSGYSVVSADSLEAAQAMFDGHPIVLQGHHTVEVCEIEEM